MAGPFIGSPGITGMAAPPAGSKREIGVAHVGPGVELRHCSGKADSAFFDDIDALGDEAGESEVLLAHEKAKALAFHLANRFDHLLDDAGGEAFGRLVEQEKRGI